MQFKFIRLTLTAITFRSCFNELYNNNIIDYTSKMDHIEETYTQEAS